MDRADTLLRAKETLLDCLERLDFVGADISAAYLAMAIDALQHEFQNGPEVPSD